ncbi:MFS transporter [Streptomyces sp. CA-135486]|uniref:MFS transporter n=1 Tax=Streptomyces sp. CA-135486 TaxID=3240049 RepID=UPI003D90753F
MPACPPSTRVHRRSGLSALTVLALGAFTLGTSELAVAGLLPVIGDDLGTSPGTAGTLVTAYAVGVALLGPLLAAVLRRVPRRRTLLGALAAQVVGNGLTAFATWFPALLAARALAGAAAAVYAVTAMATAASLTGPERQGRAVSLVFGSITVATVVGVPSSTLLGDLFGWRAVYAVLTVVAAGVLAAAVGLVPEPIPAASATREVQPSAVIGVRLLFTYTANATVTAGHYTAATYFVELLTHRTGLGTAAVSTVLVASGLAGTAGAVLGGVAADRHTRRTLLSAAAVLVCSLSVLSAVMSVPALTWPVAMIWMAAFSAFSTAAQVTVTRQAPGADIAAAANIAVFNTGIAAGSALGGLALHLFGFAGVTLAGAALFVAGLAALLPHAASPRTCG